MSARGQAIGGNDNLIRAPHITPGARCDNVIQLAGESPSAFAIGCTVPMQEMTVHSFRASPRRDANLSVLSREELRSQGLAAKKMTSHLFTTSAALKLSQVAQTMLDIAAFGFIALFIILLFASPFIAGFCVLLVSF